MRERIARHQAARDQRWLCMESPENIAEDLENFFCDESIARRGALIDCLSMWLANMLEINAPSNAIFAKLRQLLISARELSIPIAFVSAECGLGFIPTNKLARRYGDLLGEINQICARYCQSVYFVSCGLALPSSFSGRAKPQETK